MRQLVSKRDQVLANIRKFAGEVGASAEMQKRLGQVHAWYAFRCADGGWAFGPSKFVGYLDNTAEEYLRTYQNDADGRQTEHVLDRWFSQVDSTSRFGLELMEALTRFLARWGRMPRKGARINVVSDEPRLGAQSRTESDETLFARIFSDPAVCGGRPCIKGTRMRVSDIVGMMAHGASSTEILADYPYLAAEDVRAALAYAARVADHRVIRAA